LSLTLSRTGKYAESEPLAQRAVTALAAAPDYRSMYEQALDNLSFIDHQLGKPEPKVDLGGDAPQASAPAVSPPSAPKSVATRPAAPLTSVTPQTMSPVQEATSHNFEYKTQPRNSSPSAPPSEPLKVSPAPTPSSPNSQTTTEAVLRAPSTSV